MESLIRLSGCDVRAHIAAAILGDPPRASQLGDVVLHPHQREGVARVRHLLERHGGALLADEVGLGKTFMALAIAADASAPLVIAPAALRGTWMDAAQRSSVRVHFVSTEALSRRTVTDETHDLVIIDEAQHFRSPATQRFASAATLTRGARVLLISATPVQNRLDDLRAVLSLFLGERSRAMSADDLATLVVRRFTTDVTHELLSLPAVAETEILDVVSEADCLDRLLELPPPVRPAGDGDAGVLLTYTLARQWASSRAALVGALHRRLARGRAMEDALRAGRLPTRRELLSWTLSDGLQQLSFPELAVAATTPLASALLDQVRVHTSGVRELLAWLQQTPDPDATRAHALRALLAKHPGERVVAFSEYTDTVMALYRLLKPSVRAAMLTHAGGAVAGGRMTRSEVLHRFAPGSGSHALESERIDLLLTTDVLSEGVNLQDASVVVHLDLTWNPARLEQRVGRLRRIGATRDTVRVYMFAPPAPAEQLLRLERRLRAKLDEAARAIGLAGAILPNLAPRVPGAATQQQTIARLLGAWHCDVEVTTGTRAAAVLSDRNAALVCVRDERDARLIAIAGDAVRTDRESVEQLLRVADGPDVTCEASELERIRHVALRWLCRRAVGDVVDLPALRVGRARRDVLHRVDAIARRAPRHLRPRLSPLMHAARTVASGTLSAGAERVLADLADATMTDEAWLNALGEFAALHARGDDPASGEIVAILLLVRGSRAD